MAGGNESKSEIDVKYETNQLFFFQAAKRIYCSDIPAPLLPFLFPIRNSSSELSTNTPTPTLGLLSASESATMSDPTAVVVFGIIFAVRSEVEWVK